MNKYSKKQQFSFIIKQKRDYINIKPKTFILLTKIYILCKSIIQKHLYHKL